MGRIFEPAQKSERPDNTLVMNKVQARHIQETYAEYKEGIAVNDGKFMKFIDDRDGEDKDCKTCKNHLTYFDCSQCHEHDEWQRKEEV